MKKNNTNLKLTFSIIILMLISCIFIYLLTTIKNKNKHISSVAATLGERISEKENIGVIEEKMTELKATQQKIGGYIVDTSHIDIFVEYLENVGIDNNVEVKVNSVDKIKTQKNRVQGNLSIIGGFSNTMKTLAALENAPYNIMINSVYINKEDSSNYIAKVETPANTKDKILPSLPTPKSTWQVDLGFSVLSLQ